MDMKIKSLWRYPVKSFLGESLQELSLDLRGVIGDRAYAVTNTNGKFGSGKTTRRFVRINNLLSLSANTLNGNLSVIFPDGDSEKIDSNTLNSRLSEYLGQEVTLDKEKEISHFDDGAIHILTSSSLSQLKKLAPNSLVDERRFRANIVIETPEGITDEYLIGKTLQIGKAKLKIIKKTERCRMASQEQPGLDKDKEILKVISKYMGLNFGLYAKVLNPETIMVGQTVEIL